MAITRTTLAADCAFNDTQINVTSATGFADGNIILVDGEWMEQTGAASGTYIPVSRGKQGSAQVAHDILAGVVTGLATDTPDLPARADVPNPPRTLAVVYYGEDGAIDVPEVDTLVVLDKATAAAMTLAAPNRFQDGLQLIITTSNAVAHVITATALIGDGAAGSPEDTATYAAFIGATMHVVAVNGIWNVVALTGVTIT